MINRCEKIAGTAGTLDDILTAFVARSDDASGLEAAAGPDIGKGTGPVVTAWLQNARGRTRVACTSAPLKTDLRCSHELAGDDDEDTLVEPAGVNVLDQSGNGAVIVRHAETQGFELMLVHGMVIPVADPAAKRSAETAGDDFHP